MSDDSLDRALAEVDPDRREILKALLLGAAVAPLLISLTSEAMAKAKTGGCGGGKIKGPGGGCGKKKDPRHFDAAGE